MQTMPEHRPTRGEQLSEEPVTTAPATTGPEKLRIIPKSSTGRRESFFADGAFRTFVVLCALAVLAIVGLIVFELISQSRLSISKFGFKFLVKQIWDPVAED